MKESLFSKDTYKMAEDLKKAKARIQNKESQFVTKFMKETDAQTIYDVMQVITEYGHPNEVIQIKEIREKYVKGETLEGDDIITLNALYQSNIGQFKKNKDD